MKKIILSAAAIAVVLGLVLVGDYADKNELAFCLQDKDQCIQTKIDSLRGEKDAYQGKINDLNTHINDLKKGFSAGYVIEQIQTQHMQNVHPDIVTFRLIPQAHAASGDVSLPEVSLSSEQGGLRTAKQISVGRYGEMLAKKGSPYSGVPIEQYCNKAQITEYQCDILVAISGQESNFGTDFAKRKDGKIVNASEEGVYNYNPVGIKGGGISYPTPEGWYIRPFKSWDDFWSQYPTIMKTGYFDRGGTTPTIISKCYVGGDCYRVKESWVNGVESFIKEINSYHV